MKRDSKVVSILNKMGYEIKSVSPASDNPTELLSSALAKHGPATKRSKIADKIANYYPSEKIYDHTLMRVNSMNERQLANRVNKITDKEKMFTFGKVLHDNRIYPDVLDMIIDKIIYMGW